MLISACVSHEAMIEHNTFIIIITSLGKLLLLLCTVLKENELLWHLEEGAYDRDQRRGPSFKAMKTFTCHSVETSLAGSMSYYAIMHK